MFLLYISFPCAVLCDFHFEKMRYQIELTSTSTSTSTEMGQGKATPEAVQWIVVRLSSVMSEEDIAMYADISLHTVQRILSHFNRTHEVIVPKSSKCHTQSALCDYDIEVWLYYLYVCQCSPYMCF